MKTVTQICQQLNVHSVMKYMFYEMCTVLNLLMSFIRVVKQSLCKSVFLSRGFKEEAHFCQRLEVVTGNHDTYNVTVCIHCLVHKLALVVHTSGKFETVGDVIFSAIEVVRLYVYPYFQIHDS